MKKYLILPKPTEQEYYRIQEVIFFFLVQNLEHTKKDVDRQLHGLAVLADASSSLLTLAASKITEPLIAPTKEEIAITLAYLDVPVREISKEYIHHKTYYSHIYRYFDLESTEPRLTHRLSVETIREIIKLLNYIRNTFDVFDIARKKVTYDTDN